MRWHPPYFLFLLCKHQLNPRARTGKSKGPTGLPGEWDLLRPALLLLGNWGEEIGWENWLGWAISANQTDRNATAKKR